MSLPPRRRVRLWFGEYQLADYIGEPASAARHEAALRRRFPGLEVTNLPLGEPHEVPSAPCEVLNPETQAPSTPLLSAHGPARPGGIAEA